MIIPNKSYRQNVSQDINAFYGINRRRKAGMGEFRDMENLFANEEYPCLSSVRGYVDTNMTLPDNAEIVKHMPLMFGVWDNTKFSGVAKLTESVGDEVTVKYAIYINGVKKRDDISEFFDAVDYNGAIITIPEFKGFNYLVQGDYVSDLQSIQTESISFKNLRLMHPSENPRTKGEHLLKFDGTTAPPYSKFYEKFNVGDVLAFSKSGNERYDTVYPANSQDYTARDRPVTVTITKLDDTVDAAVSTVSVMIMDAKGAFDIYFGGSDTGAVMGNGFTISKLIPQITHAVCFKNRIWATGKSGESVFVSALAKPFDFYIQDGKADASCTVPVPYSGDFVGIDFWDNRVLAFKEDNLSVIYGTDPTEYAVYKNYDIGCIDGKSIAQCGNMVIWLYHDGFYAYAGGEPQRISDKLHTRYKSAKAFSTSRLYFARCEKENGEFELVVYDTERNIWSKLSDVDFVNAFYFGGKAYIGTKTGLKTIEGGDYGDFYAETGDITFDSFDNKSVIYFYLRCDISDGAFINIYTKTDGGDWQAHKGISKSGKHKIPIRYKSGDSIAFRIEGSGKVHIDDIKIMINNEVR